MHGRALAEAKIRLISKRKMGVSFVCERRFGGERERGDETKERRNGGTMKKKKKEKGEEKRKEKNHTVRGEARSDLYAPKRDLLQEGGTLVVPE